MTVGGVEECLFSVFICFVLGLPLLTVPDITIESCAIDITWDGTLMVLRAIYRLHSDTIDNFNIKLPELLMTL